MISIQRATVVLTYLLAGTLALAAEVKVGAFDFQRVSEETSRGQDLQASLGKFRDKKQSEIATKETELKTLRDQYSAQALTLSPDKRSQMEKDIQRKDLDLQSVREGARREMELEVNEAQAKFQEQLLGVVTSVGKERGYTMIFEKSQAVFFADSTDITSEIVEKFNQDSAKAAAPPAAGSAAPAAPAKPPEAKKPTPPKPPAGKPETAKPGPGGGAPGGGSKPPSGFDLPRELAARSR